MKITVLTIHHKHGVNMYPCANQQIADACLYEFVKQWWADTFEDEPIPDDRQEAIDEYFNCDLSQESYEFFEDTLIESLPSEEVSA